MKTLVLSILIMAALSSFYNPVKTDTDKGFMVKAAQNNMAEIDAAKLALQKSTSGSIKSFAQMMIEDHTAALNELKTLAQQKSVMLPDSTDDTHRLFAQRLMLVSGSSFDSAYMQAQVRDHVATIAVFQAEVSNGIDAQAKAYANKLLPKLQMHLQHAQNVAGNTGSMMNDMQHQNMQQNSNSNGSSNNNSSNSSNSSGNSYMQNNAGMDSSGSDSNSMSATKDSSQRR